MSCNAMHPIQDLFLEGFHMYFKLIFILYALLCGQNFILVKSGCYTDLGLRGMNELPDHWVMYFNGSYTLKGVVLIPPEGDIVNYAIQLDFSATNNIAEYKVLVTGLHLAKDLGIR
jgi:hypothetical protein